MPSRRRVGGGLALTALALAAGVLALPDLPARTAIHFGVGGDPDSFVSPIVAVVLTPAIMLATLAFLEGLARIDEVRDDLEDGEGTYDALVLVTLGFVAGVQGLVLAYNLGYDVSIAVAAPAAIAVVYVVLGAVTWTADGTRVLAKASQSRPAAGADADGTQRVAAVGLVLAGAVTLAGATLAPSLGTVVAVGSGLAVAAATTLYAVLVARRRDDGAGDDASTR